MVQRCGWAWQQVKDTTAECVGLKEWFAEPTADKEPEKFFALVRGFAKALEAADRFNKESVERERKKKERLEKAAKQAEARRTARRAGGAQEGSLTDTALTRQDVMAAQFRFVDEFERRMEEGKIKRH